MTPSDLRRLVEYDKDTGLLTWRPRDGNNRFNAKLSGKPAFSQVSGGYLIGRLNGVNLKAHRVAWAIHYGEWPPNQIDHINGIRSDNRLVNLRSVVNSENGKNQKTRSTNKSGEPCISWFGRDAKWWVKITVDGKTKHIGYFDTIDAAIAARDSAWKENGFHENHGR